jgi:hypothetical protein
VEILQGEKSPESSLKSVDKIRFEGDERFQTIRSGRSYMEDSHKVFQHFRVQKFGRLDKVESRSLKS